MTDQQGSIPDAEGVIPPPPPGPSATPAVPPIQLAPPLGAPPPAAQPYPAAPYPAAASAAPYPAAPPPAAHAPAAPQGAPSGTPAPSSPALPSAAPLPPYAYAASANAQAPSGAYPAPPPAPAGPASGASGTPAWLPAAMFTGIGVALVAAVTIVAFLVVGELSEDPVGRPDTLPTFTLPPTDRPIPDPSIEPKPEPTDPAPPSSGVSAAEVGDWLGDKIDEYKRARDDGSLWTRIPDNAFNQTAVTAFLYFLTDMKSATLFGIDQATADEYVAETARLEGLLLAQQPLGDDIEITFDDGGFRYDGDTGEGGYFE